MDILHIFENGHNFATALPIDVLVGSRVPGWGFQQNDVDFFPRGLHTCTAVTRLPRDSQALLLQYKFHPEILMGSPPCGGVKQGWVQLHALYPIGDHFIR